METWGIAISVATCHPH